MGYAYSDYDKGTVIEYNLIEKMSVMRLRYSGSNPYAPI